MIIANTCNLLLQLGLYARGKQMVQRYEPSDCVL